MHTTAHPDDEHGGMLAWLSRGLGARVALMTLNRGQSGDNALGPQLFDGLGLIRTEELAAANRYYGVDAQYYTSVIDYGFSKRLEEAFEKWGREPVLRDVVRIVRLERPLVLVSRFQGTARDGHGNHQTAGVITLQAFQAAGDPRMFPDQIADGLRPWRPARVFIGGMREDEAWDVRIDAGQYSPWLGMSYGDFARVGLSFQRSQTSGRLVLTPGPQYNYYQRADKAAADRPPARGARERRLLRRHRHLDHRPVRDARPSRAARRRGPPAADRPGRRGSPAHGVRGRPGRDGSGARPRARRDPRRHRRLRRRA